MQTGSGIALGVVGEPLMAGGEDVEEPALAAVLKLRAENVVVRDRAQ